MHNQISPWVDVNEFYDSDMSRFTPVDGSITLLMDSPFWRRLSANLCF